VERGLALPTSDFLRGLLSFYGVQIHHMNPNSILHLSIFVHLCEAFLGIQPHWNLFCYLFHLKPQPDSNNPSRIGGYGLQLNQGQGSEYLAYSTPTSLSGWKNCWFYIGNHAPSLPVRTHEALVPEDCWKYDVSEEDMAQVWGLLQKIQDLRKVGITGTTILLSWLWRRIQPLQLRTHFGYEYAGVGEPSRITSEELVIGWP